MTLTNRRVTIAVACIALLVMQLIQTYHTDLFMRRELINQGEWWRLLTGHLVHLDWMHFLLNLGTLVVTILLLSVFNRLDILSVVTLWSALLISTGLLVTTNNEWYAGYSGISYALLTAGALTSYRDRISQIVIAFLLIKFFIELSGTKWIGAILIEVEAVVESHWLGMLAGVLAVWPILKFPRTEERKIAR